MFDVLVDTHLEAFRDWAKGGDFDAMVTLAGHLQEGKHTRRNEKLALKILDHVLERKAEITFPEVYWNALGWKSQLVDEETAEQIYLELIRDMTRYPLEKWVFHHLGHAVQWLESFHLDRETGN